MRGWHRNGASSRGRGYQLVEATSLFLQVADIGGGRFRVRHALPHNCLHAFGLLPGRWHGVTGGSTTAVANLGLLRTAIRGRTRVGGRLAPPARLTTTRQRVVGFADEFR